jgi:hypothetical protein
MVTALYFLGGLSEQEPTQLSLYSNYDTSYVSESPRYLLLARIRGFLSHRDQNCFDFHVASNLMCSGGSIPQGKAAGG